jgi:hypothetical protein
LYCIARVVVIVAIAEFRGRTSIRTDDDEVNIPVESVTVSVTMLVVRDACAFSSRMPDAGNSIPTCTPHADLRKTGVSWIHVHDTIRDGSESPSISRSLLSLPST